MCNMASVEDVIELGRLLDELVQAIERGDLEASPAHVAALVGARSVVEFLQQSDV